MDLHLPIETKLDMVYNIQKDLSFFVNIKIEYYKALGELEAIEGLDNKFYLAFDRIFESNCNYEMMPILERLRDAF